MTAPARSQLAPWSLDAVPGATVGTWTLALRAAAAALAITLVQVAAVMGVALATGAAHGGSVYESLCRWDGNLYIQIAKRGYHGAPPGNPVDFQASNVAFFPGYPLAARWVHALAGGAISFPAAMVLTAQLAAWGFWTYWLLLLRRYGVARGPAVVATVMAVAHPAAFFLVVAYSESMFLFGLLGFLYWARVRDPRGWLLAAAHGFVMTGTRLGGLAVTFCPLAAQVASDAAVHARALWSRARLREELPEWLRLAALGAVASLGAIGFLAFCHGKFGAWDLYMQTQKAGWNVSADWFWFARSVNYVFFGSLWHPNVLWPDDLSRFCVLASMLLMAAMIRHEWRLAKLGPAQWQPRAVLYLAALGLFLLHAAGVSPILMKSMIRYCYGVHLLLLLAAIHITRTWPRSAWSTGRLAWIGVVTAAAALVQLAMAWRFFSDQWVA